MPSNKAIIGFVGEIASGKGASAEYLHSKYGAAIFKFSASMRDIAGRLYLEPTRYNIQMVSTALRQHFGDDLFAKVMAKDVAASSAGLVITDGIRRPSDIVELAKLPGFHLIAIVAEEKARYERIRLRGENAGDADKTWDDFIKDSQAEAENKVREIAAKAEATIDNNGSIADLHAKLDELMKKINAA
jgi:dephospho-CoA kinase